MTCFNCVGYAASEHKCTYIICFKFHTYRFECPVQSFIQLDFFIYLFILFSPFNLHDFMTIFICYELTDRQLVRGKGRIACRTFQKYSFIFQYLLLHLAICGPTQTLPFMEKFLLMQVCT